MKKRNIDFRAVGFDLLRGLGIALLYSFFIYAEYFGLTFELINTFTALAAFYLFLKAPARVILSAGFFIGLLWFYWIGYSFEYYHVGWLTPFITLFFALLYTLFFGTLAFTRSPLYRALILFALSFVEVMDWNWLQAELPFINTFFGVDKWQYALILLALALFIYLSARKELGKIRYAPLLLLIGALNFSHPDYIEPHLKIKLYAPQLLQEEKWLPQNSQAIAIDNLNAIKNAIKEGYDLVVLPESAFPLFLNKSPQIESLLRKYSYQIDIVTGGLYLENKLHYNVSYHFSQGRVQIAKKLVLVPFGEYIPLPSFLKAWVNTTFFDGASDFVTAKEPSDFIIKGIRFRSAVCYEATCEEIYDGDPKYLIAISNNGWFNSSIEPTLQKLLMRFYAKKHHSIIYHSANMGGAGVIRGNE